MQFFNPQAFLLLWLIPLVVVLYIISAKIRDKRIRLFGERSTVYEKLMVHYRKEEIRIRAILMCLVFFFAVMALARPQWGEEKKSLQRKGVDIIFMLDTSLSMLAEDIKPNRLEKSKLEIKSFIKELKGDRVGMVAFAGSSFLQTPLTLDYSAFFLFLDAIRTGYIPDPGTSLDKALKMAIESFPEQEMKHRAIVLFTDGEDHGGGMESVLKDIREAGVRIYAIGVGREDGDPIPLKDDRGNRMGYKKDRQGEIVITRLNKELLEKIAAESGGLYLPATPGERELDVIIKHMESLGQRKFKEKLVTEKEDHFQIFLVLALMMLFMEMMVRRRKKASELMMLLLCFFLCTGFIETTKSLNDQGNRHFEDKKYQSAIDAYRKAQIKNPDDPSLHYNLGTTLYETQDYQESNRHLSEVVEKAPTDDLKAKALYNHGNVLYRLGKFDEAIKAYEGALEINPDDEDAKYNLEVLQRSKNRFEQKDNDKKQDSQDEQQQQDKPKPQENKNQQDEQDQQDQENNQEQEQQPQGKGDQEEKDQNQDQNQDGEGGEDEEKQDDKPSEDGEEQDQQQKPEDQGDQEQPARPDDQPGEQEQDQPQGDQQDEREQQQPQGQDQKQPQGGAQGGQEEREEPQPSTENPQNQQQQRRPLQGQMSKDQALRILDALKEGEKDLQDLRRPPAGNEKHQDAVLKDW